MGMTLAPYEWPEERPCLFSLYQELPELGYFLLPSWTNRWSESGPSLSLSSVSHDWPASAPGLKDLQALGSGLAWCPNGGRKLSWAEPRKVEWRGTWGQFPKLRLGSAWPTPLSG